MCGSGLDWISDYQAMLNHMRQEQPKTCSGQVDVFVFKAECMVVLAKASMKNEIVTVLILEQLIISLFLLDPVVSLSILLSQKDIVKLPISRAEQVLNMNS